MNETEIRELFPGLNGTIYLNTATQAVGCGPARDAYVRAADRWSRAEFDWVEAERAGEDARGFFAQLVGAGPEEVALIPAVSSAAGIVAANLPPARSGENIVVADCEFSSNYFPWLLLRDRGYEIRRVLSVHDSVPAGGYAELSDRRTRLIASSAVHSRTGYRADIGALREIASRSGAWLFVDACQAAGAVPLDVRRDEIDFLAAASHKFLLGSRGMGFLYLRESLLDQVRPVLPGWKAAEKPLESFYGPTMELSSTASKLDTSLDWFSALAQQAAFSVFRRLGVQAIFDRNVALSTRLHDALAARRQSFHPFPPQHRSTIVSVPVDDTDAVMARLRDARVVAAVRAGRVRLSCHFYNRPDEIDTVVELLS